MGKKQLVIFGVTLSAVLALGTVLLILIMTKTTPGTERSESINAVSVGNLSENVADSVVSADGILVTIGTELPSDNVSENETTEEVVEEGVHLIETAEENRIVLTFAGDVLFDPNYAIYASYLQRGEDLTACISQDVLDRMHAADIMMINNEFPYSDRGEALQGKTYTFRAPTQAVSLLNDMGVDVVSVANNHTFDFGETGLLDTLTTLENAGMPYTGAGRNIEEAAQPVYFQADGVKVGTIAATQIERMANPDTRAATETLPGVLQCYDPEYLANTIAEVKENCDYLILFIHWGTESTDELHWAQTEHAALYAEAGADIIIGAHPHVLQEVGFVDGIPVVYSMGNFWFSSYTLDSCMISLTLQNGEFESLEFIPCIQKGCGVQMLYGEDRERVLNYMRSISETAVIDENGFIYPAE